jgi:6-phosphogluconolactonase
MILVATYTDLNVDCLGHAVRGLAGAGILTFMLNLKDGTLYERGAVPLAPNPAFLVKHDKLPVIYGATECINAPGEVFTLSMDPGCEAGIKLMGRTEAGGRSTCYLNVCVNDKTLTAINYFDAKVTTLPIDEASGAVSGPVAFTYMAGFDHAECNNNGMEPHTHCAVSDPYSSARNRMFVCNIGRDIVMHFRLEERKLTWTGEVKLREGTGPRHAVFHLTVRACYISNELSSSVSFYKFNRQ